MNIVTLATGKNEFKGINLNHLLNFRYIPEYTYSDEEKREKLRVYGTELPSKQLSDLMLVFINESVITLQGAEADQVLKVLQSLKIGGR